MSFYLTTFFRASFLGTPPYKGNKEIKPFYCSKNERPRFEVDDKPSIIRKVNCFHISEDVFTNIKRICYGPQMMVVDFYGTTSTFSNTKLKHGKFSKNIIAYMKTVNFPY